MHDNEKNVCVKGRCDSWRQKYDNKVADMIRKCTYLIIEI
jgi:hypothetical protein